MVHAESDYYVQTQTSFAEKANLILKYGDTFLITDRHGDIRPLGFEEHGLFHNETRFLSRRVFKLEDKSPLLLSSAVKQGNDLLSVDLTNQNFYGRGGDLIRSGNIHLSRSIFLSENCCYEHLKIVNYSLMPLEFFFSIEFEADYADIFEIRGTKRERRGQVLSPHFENGLVVLGYQGLDGILRQTGIDASPPPVQLTANEIRFSVNLGRHQVEDFYIRTSCNIGQDPRRMMVFDQALNSLKSWFQKRHEGSCVIETSNEQFNETISRSSFDLSMMLTETRHGLYPYAGIPWYSTVFGRDGIITALETLWISPEIAQGVLNYLAAEQAAEVVPEQDAEPGKILHEERKGEMANTREIPFGRYYGTVDATPLFIVLAGSYYERTGDLNLIRRIWPKITKSLEWINTSGDPDGDGFVEYHRKAADGLGNQGWKDSGDSIFHSDGTLAVSPIALCEVQGYVYEAKRKAGRLALALGEKEFSERLFDEAEALREKFLATFWLDDLGTYALALDDRKQPCRVRTSNAGHCLFSGISTEEHAQILARSLIGEGFFSGWGIRTVASSELRYNPMSYHNGSVWPHDNAILALGMARFGFKENALKILSSLFEASLFFDLHRLPELFCGFDRSREEGPILYPVACQPQAWTSGAFFMLLQACFGLSIRAAEKKIFFDRPLLPLFLKYVTIKNLRIGSGSVDLVLSRRDHDVGVNITRKEGALDVIIMK